MIKTFNVIRFWLYDIYDFKYNFPHIGKHGMIHTSSVIHSSLNEAWFECELCMHVYGNFFVEGTILPEMNRLYGETYDYNY